MTISVIYSETHEIRVSWAHPRRKPEPRCGGDAPALAGNGADVTLRRDTHDDPYGLGLDGAHVEGLPFLNPYRSIGELNETELMKLRRHPFEVAAAVIDTYAKEGVEALNAIPGEVERLKWVGVYPSARAATHS